MYCSQCGKKVLDSMLFCPFCGAQIIIPDQDVREPEEPVKAAPEPEPAPEPVREEPAFSFDLQKTLEEELPEGETPQIEDLFPWERPGEEPEAEPGEPAPAEDIPEPEPEPEPDPAPREKKVDRRPPNAGNIVPGRRSAETYVPDKPLMADKSEMFLDDADDFDIEPEDDYDDYDDDTDDYDDFEEEVERQARKARRKAGRGRRRDDVEDEDEAPGFVMRHIRGIVGILLFLILAAILAFYALSDSGQRTLAQINATLPLRADVYKRLGYEAYQSGDYAQSGTYYERALAREPDNYDYASSAAMAYITGGDNDRAAEMLRKCVQLKPEAVEPYVYLLSLYPNANSRPWDVAQLLKQGYEKTGDTRLEAAANGTEQG